MPRYSRSSRWLVRFPRGIPLGVFAAAMAITALGIFAIERIEEENEAIEQRKAIALIGSALERRASEAGAFLQAGAALFGTKENVSPDDFRQFVGEIQDNASYRGEDGIGWAAKVERDDFPRFERAAALDLGRDYRVWSDLDDRQLFAVPVTYLEPDTERNRRASGFDMYSEPVRRLAMDLAIDEKRPTASGRVLLKQEGGAVSPGFLIYMPVFENQGGEREVRGFVYSPFNGETFLESALELESVNGYGIELIDSESAAEPMATFPLMGEQVGRIVRESVTIGNRDWILRVSAPQQAGFSLLSWVTLIFGLLVAALLAAITRLLARQAFEDQSAIEWFREQNSIRTSLTRELNHRVKNTLANVLSIIALTRRRADDLDSFVESLTGRVRALSATHDLLTQSDWANTPIRSVIEAELAPYVVGSDSDRLELDGPDAVLAPKDALSLGLAIHELATNAAKYGALSSPDGAVQVRWKNRSADLLEVAWIESGGPQVDAQKERGFGLDLIERIVAHELGHPIDIKFPPEGVRCNLLVPLRRQSAFTPRASQS